MKVNCYGAADFVFYLKFDIYNYGIFNFGAHTHTNIAIRDAILSVKLPFYEVHISNIYAREEFRHHSFFSDIAKGSIVGFGMDVRIGLDL